VKELESHEALTASESGDEGGDEYAVERRKAVSAGADI